MAEEVLPSRRMILKDCSRLVEGRRGKPVLLLCFSSVLRLCLWPGRCNRDAVELLGVRPLRSSCWKESCVGGGFYNTGQPWLPVEHTSNFLFTHTSVS